MIYRLMLTVARRLAAVRLYHWRFVADSSQGDRFRKCRTTWAEILIPPGNWYLWAQGVLSEVLPLQKWIAWEMEVASRLGRMVQILEDRQGLDIPRIPGHCLDDLLRADLPLTDKLQAIFLSAVALRNLHQFTASLGEGHDPAWVLSHGDATCRNVIVNVAAGTASWIDFDMRHRLGTSSLTRHADDLRALLWSSAARLDASAVRDCVAAAFEGYAVPDVTLEVQRLLKRLACPTVFQLAQAPISPSEFVRLCDAVQKYAHPTEPPVETGGIQHR